MLPSDMAEFGRSLLSSAAFVSNHFFYRLADYFGGQSDLKPLLHTWSLSIEEQFYLVLATAVPGRRTLAVWMAAHVVGAVGAISLTACVVMVGVQKEAAFFLAPFRAWELLLGAALALSTRRPAIPAWMAELAAGAGLSMILASVLLLDEDHAFPGILAVPPCLGAALLILAGMDKQPAVTRLLSTRPLVAVGLLSYSLYLWHWPILSFARYQLDRPLQWGGCRSAGEPAGGIRDLSLRGAARTPPSLARAPQVIGAGGLSLGAVALAGHEIDTSRGWTFNLDPEFRRLDTAARSETSTTAPAAVRTHLSQRRSLHLRPSSRRGLLRLGDLRGTPTPITIRPP